MKVGLIFGTRPEGIKVAPVYHELKNQGIEVKAVVTGQHKEMLNQVLTLFNIVPVALSGAYSILKAPFKFLVVSFIFSIFSTTYSFKTVLL